MKILSFLSFAIPIVLQLIILFLLIRKVLRKRFHWFFIYIVYDFVNAIIRMIVSGNKNFYFMIYWSTSAVEIIFIFLALRESFLNVLRPFTQTNWFRWLFCVTSALAVAYSIVKAVLQPSVKTSVLVAIALQGEQTFEYLVMAAALLYFGMYFFLMHIPKIKAFKYESGVVLGFAISAVLSNFGVLTRSVFGTRFFSVSKWLPAVAYIVGEVVWLQTFLRTEQDNTKPPLDLTPEQMLTDMGLYQRFINRARTWLRRK